MNKTTVIDFITSTKFIFCLLVVITIMVGLQQLREGTSHMLNVAIFKMSYYNLINHQNPYTIHPMYEGRSTDIYKYSPAFSLLFAPIAILPLWLGTIVWNLLNVLVFFFAIRSLPLSDIKKSVIILLVLLELIITIQNSQSNLLMASLIIFGFTCMEKEHIVMATLCIVLSIYIKLFGAIALMFFLFYPGKLKFIGYTILWCIVFTLLPLLVNSFSQLEEVYRNWAIVLKMDANEIWGLSVMGIAKAWFGITTGKIYMQLGGLILLAIPLLSVKNYNNLQFKILYLASILIWVVTFNHKAESPSYIIAMAGIAIWFVSENKTPYTIALMVFAIVFTSLAHSDLLPRSFRTNFIDVYMIKALPAFLIWGVVQFKLYIMAFTPQPLQASGSIDGLQK